MENDKELENRIRTFQMDMCPFGYRDISAGLNILRDFGMDNNDLLERLEDWIEECGVKVNDVDITYLAYDMILQEVRNTIDSTIDFDIQNDVYFEIYGNFMCTEFTYSEEDKEALVKAIKEADVNDRDELLIDKNVITWLEYIEIDVKDLVS